MFIKNKLKSNIKGPFYFREEYFDRSFTFKHEKLLYHYSLEILKSIYCFRMIRSFQNQKKYIWYKNLVKNLCPLMVDTLIQPKLL